MLPLIYANSPFPYITAIFFKSWKLIFFSNFLKSFNWFGIGSKLIFVKTAWHGIWFLKRCLWHVSRIAFIFFFYQMISPDNTRALLYFLFLNFVCFWFRIFLIFIFLIFSSLLGIVRIFVFFIFSFLFRIFPIFLVLILFFWLRIFLILLFFYILFRSQDFLKFL